VEKYKFLGSIFTNDLKVDEEIKNRRNAMLGNLQQYKDAISSKHFVSRFQKNYCVSVPRREPFLRGGNSKLPPISGTRMLEQGITRKL
jgi:hypothetical protein